MAATNANVELRSKYTAKIYMTALIILVDELLFNMDNNKVTGLTFINFKKAFNVINLMTSFLIYGVGSSSITWFTSYLLIRQKTVC